MKERFPEFSRKRFRQSSCRRFLESFSNVIATYSFRVLGFPGGSFGKESACNAGDPGSMSWVMKIPWRRKWLPTSVFLPGKFHGQRTLVGYSPWGHKQSDMNERLTFSLSFRILKTQEGIGQFNHHILFTILRIYDTSSVKNAVFQKFLFIYFCLCWVFLMLHAIVL